MKSQRIYTAKGSVLANTVQRLKLFDGRFDTAYRILDFSIAPRDIATGENVGMKIITEEKTHNDQWFWENNNEVGWGSYTKNTGNGPGEFTRWDKDALIVEDLYLDCTADAGEFVNYMITLEKVSISDWKGALAMVRNKSQGVD